MRLRLACAAAAAASALLLGGPAAAAPSTLVSAGNGTCRDVAFTYDTEFGEITPTLAATLEDLNIRATFFFVGDSVDDHADLVKRLAVRHQVANHTWSHPFMAQLSPDEMRQELLLAEERITAVAGQSPQPFWRPPYGNYDDTVLEAAGELGYAYTIYWSMDTVDWAGPSAEVIRERLVAGAFPGGIALMHGSPLATPDGTWLAAGDLRALGYQFVTVSEILGLDRHLRDFGGDAYIVQPGDDMARVAGCHNVTAARLLAYNEIDSPPAGTVLAIPHTTEVVVRLDGERISFPVWPRIVDARTVAHVRLAERLGAAVEWDGERVHVVSGATELIVTPGERMALVNGAPADMGTAAIMEANRVLVPVRFLAERLGWSVGWDSETWTVSISG
ncbi:MAG TPA: polysaccharide deacetylase family protein [Symbiobacteriaceae bacterium]|nr:polysaccharide deacetylase family protein [Symbiobacteriaceae bacterium]